MYSNRYYCTILKTLEHCRQFFKKLANIKLYENPSNGSRFVPCGGTDRQTDRQTDGRKEGGTDVRKPLVPFLNFANTHKNYWVVCKNTQVM